MQSGLLIGVNKMFTRVLFFKENEAARTNNEWCISTVKKLKEASPLGLKVSLRSIREGRNQTLDQCRVREYQMSLKGISKQISRDLCEGVRARLVDKDLAPKWDPSCLDNVMREMVDHYFSLLGESEPKLELLTKIARSVLLIGGILQIYGKCPMLLLKCCPMKFYSLVIHRAVH
ncbi:hypothetical protein IFM89_036519 [Coptis chinensis]|uniref:3-hydroxyisobutyryl-CoA hydrolase n=1 Tax=Coptis chinensis TaxID=261450 RepID=A0A835LHL0_9MAGN|nr:hypothetical protein IFM89_036519 [Coptis chinensis]